jgi:CBS domain-containing protein
MKVREIMSRDPVCCTAETNLQEVARMMLDRDCGEIPVVDGVNTRRPLGVVTDRDIVCRAVARGATPSAMVARDVMTTPVVTVTPETSIEECCRLLEERQVRRAPVIDGSGSCCGMVALADIANHASDNVSVGVLKTVSQPQPARQGRYASDVSGEFRA